MTERVTVLIAVRNTGRWLAETIASVRAQTITDWKLIAIDDGSTDGTPAILQELVKNDPRMKALTRENRGLVATRNELLALADTDFIAWLDSDDRMTPDRLEKQLAAFDADPQLLCLGGAAQLIDPVGLPIKQHAFPTSHEQLVTAMRDEIAFYFPSVTMRREAAIKVGGFRQPLAIGEDFDLCLRLSEIGRVGNLLDIILHYRQHLASTANSARPRTHIYSKLVRDLAAERRTTGTDRLQRNEKITLDFSGLPTGRRVIRETYMRWAWWALEAKNLPTARKYAWKSFRRGFWRIGTWRLLACTLRGH